MRSKGKAFNVWFNLLNCIKCYEAYVFWKFFDSGLHYRYIMHVLHYRYIIHALKLILAKSKLTFKVIFLFECKYCRSFFISFADTIKSFSSKKLQFSILWIAFSFEKLYLLYINKFSANIMSFSSMLQVLLFNANVQSSSW